MSREDKKAYLNQRLYGKSRYGEGMESQGYQNTFAGTVGDAENKKRIVVENTEITDRARGTVNSVSAAIPEIVDFSGKLRKELGFNSGGYVNGPEGTDVIPAYLSKGEFVMKNSAVKKYGSGMMKQINAGNYADGDEVGTVVPSYIFFRKVVYGDDRPSPYKQGKKYKQTLETTGLEIVNTKAFANEQEFAESQGWSAWGLFGKIRTRAEQEEINKANKWQEKRVKREKTAKDAYGEETTFIKDNTGRTRLLSAWQQAIAKGDRAESLESQGVTKPATAPVPATPIKEAEAEDVETTALEALRKTVAREDLNRDSGTAPAAKAQRPSETNMEYEERMERGERDAATEESVAKSVYGPQTEAATGSSRQPAAPTPEAAAAAVKEAKNIFSKKDPAAAEAKAESKSVKTSRSLGERDAAVDDMVDNYWDNFDKENPSRYSKRKEDREKRAKEHAATPAPPTQEVEAQNVEATADAYPLPKQENIAQRLKEDLYKQYIAIKYPTIGARFNDEDASDKAGKDFGLGSDAATKWLYDKWRSEELSEGFSQQYLIQNVGDFRKEARQYRTEDVNSMSRKDKKAYLNARIYGKSKNGEGMGSQGYQNTFAGTVGGAENKKRTVVENTEITDRARGMVNNVSAAIPEIVDVSGK